MPLSIGRGNDVRALSIALSLLVFCAAASAADAPEASRYTLSGSGTLRSDTPVQSAATLRLKATLLEQDAALAASPPVQENGPYALMAAITAAPSVCYSDTIFRDDFDGDGY